jgi:hypothetical protein
MNGYTDGKMTGNPIQQALRDMNARISFLESVPVFALLATIAALLALSAYILARRWSMARLQYST